MCGISGTISANINERHQKIIADVMQSQKVRGPDYQSMQKIDSRTTSLLFAHNRLSIIDLSLQANQPMWDNTGRYCVVYNGEIYNYLELRTQLSELGLNFFSQSDTEVILNAFSYWGIKALEFFQGPFAFALFDKETEALWLCRDRFGVRPLYYTQDKNDLFFASSTKMLAQHLNRKPNMNYVARGLKYFVYENGNDESAYEGLSCVKPGEFLRIQLNKESILEVVAHSYYDLASQVENKIENIRTLHSVELLEELNAHFENAVNIRLRSDVPVGISLSGGLDSSSVAALVSKHNPHTVGFSFGHPGNTTTEGPLVAYCAKYLGIEIDYVSPTPNEMVAGLFKTILLQDAPFSSLSVVAQALLYERVNQHGIKVLLGGQGGDEAFMGYRKFFAFYLQTLLRNKKYFSLARNALSLLPMFVSEIRQAKLYWRQRNRYLGNQGFSSALELPNLNKVSLGKNSSQTLWARQITDVTQYSLPTLLRYEDRNGMGHSVESRLPFLDHQLMEFGLALPTAFKINKGFGKWPMREIMKDKIPNQIRMARYKRGFDISLQDLMQAGLGNSIRQVLQDNYNQLKDFFRSPININVTYSDKQLLTRQNAMTEVITLLWLASVTT